MTNYEHFMALDAGDVFRTVDHDAVFVKVLMSGTHMLCTKNGNIFYSSYIMDHTEDSGITVIGRLHVGLDYVHAGFRNMNS